VQKQAAKANGHGMRGEFRRHGSLCRMHSNDQPRKIKLERRRSLFWRRTRSSSGRCADALQEVLETEMTGKQWGREGEGSQAVWATFGSYGSDADHEGRHARGYGCRRPSRAVFSTELSSGYQRRAGDWGMCEGVSPAGEGITEELCGQRFSASSISAIKPKTLESLAQFADRRWHPLFFDEASTNDPRRRYERVREAGVITSQAVRSRSGIDCGRRGRRSVVGGDGRARQSREPIELADFRLGLKVFNHVTSLSCLTP